MLKGKKLLSLALSLFVMLNLIIIPGAVSADTVGDNLFVNGGFEEGIVTPWDAETTGLHTLSASTATSHSGSYSAYVSGRTGAAQRPIQKITVEPDKTYLTSGWVKLENDVFVGAEIYPDQSGCGTGVDPSNKESVKETPSNSAWTQQQRIFTTEVYDQSCLVAVGLVVWGTENYYIDDMFAGELIVGSIDVSGGTKIAIPKTGQTAKTANLTAVVKNQIGTTVGLESETVTWSLVGNPTGVSIDATTGQLTVTDAAQEGTITVRATCNPTYLGHSQESVSSDIEVELLGAGYNMLGNGGFETGDTTSWSMAGELEASTAEVHSGSYSGFVKSRPDVGQKPNQTIVAEPGKVYIASGWVKQIDGDGNPYGTYGALAVQDSNGTEIATDSISIPVGNTEWVQKQTLFNTYDKNAAFNATVGLQIYNNIQYYIDDMFAGELVVGSIDISGDTKVVIPRKDDGAKTISLTGVVKNQVGTTLGLESQTVSSWSLVGNPTGVSIDANGQLTVTSAAQAGTITVRATCIPTYQGASQASASSDVEIELLGAGYNMLGNGGFETGNTTSWSMEGELEASTAEVHSGSYSGFVKSRPHTGDKPNQTIVAEPGKVYIASGWIKQIDQAGQNDYGTYGALAVQDANNTDIASTSIAIGLGNTEWVQAQTLFNTYDKNASFDAKVGLVVYNNIQYYVDDMFAGELIVGSIDVSGDTKIVLPKKGEAAKTANLTAVVKNQTGTTLGLENETVSSWSLVGNPAGVSIDAATGQLTVTDAAQVGTITVRATCIPTYQGASQASVSSDVEINLCDSLTTNVVFKANGTPVDELVAGDITAELNLSNNGDEPANVTFFFALYEETSEGIYSLKDLVSGDFDEPVAGGQTGTLTLERALAVPKTEGYLIKAFVWDSVNSMRPVGSATILQ